MLFQFLVGTSPPAIPMMQQYPTTWPMVISQALPIIASLIAALTAFLANRKIGAVAASTDIIHQKQDAMKVVTDATYVLNNSQTEASLMLLVGTLEELLVAKPGDSSVIARLKAAKEKLIAHRQSQAIVDDRATQLAIATAQKAKPQ